MNSWYAAILSNKFTCLNGWRIVGSIVLTFTFPLKIHFHFQYQIRGTHLRLEGGCDSTDRLRLKGGFHWLDQEWVTNVPLESCRQIPETHSFQIFPLMIVPHYLLSFNLLFTSWNSPLTFTYLTICFHVSHHLASCISSSTTVKFDCRQSSKAIRDSLPW